MGIFSLPWTFISSPINHIPLKEYCRLGDRAHRPARGTASSQVASAREILAGIRRLWTTFLGLPGLSAARDLSPPSFRQRSPWARAMAGRSSSPRSSSPGLDRGREARGPTAGFIALRSGNYRISLEVANYCPTCNYKPEYYLLIFLTCQDSRNLDIIKASNKGNGDWEKMFCIYQSLNCWCLLLNAAGTEGPAVSGPSGMNQQLSSH